MKKILTLVVLVALTTTASAQFKFGVKGGMNITAMSFNHRAVTAENRTGFYVGPTMKLIAPNSGLGFDFSVLYDQRRLSWYDDVDPTRMGDKEDIKQQQISLPLNFRWEWNMDVIGLFVYAGPELDINVSGDYDYDSFYWGWNGTRWSANIGLGIMFVGHLQLNFNYNFACNRGGGFHGNGSRYDGDRGSFNSWQLGLALYL